MDLYKKQSNVTRLSDWENLLRWTGVVSTNVIIIKSIKKSRQRDAINRVPDLLSQKFNVCS